MTVGQLKYELLNFSDDLEVVMVLFAQEGGTQIGHIDILKVRTIDGQEVVMIKELVG